MHVQRIHYSKLVVIALIVALLVLFVVQKGDVHSNSIGKLRADVNNFYADLVLDVEVEVVEFVRGRT